MASPIAIMYHPEDATIEKVWEGFSWPCFALGVFWYLYKGMWSWALIALLSLVVTLGFSWLLFPFFANEHHATHLREKGYLTQAEWATQQLQLRKPVSS